MGNRKKTPCQPQDPTAVEKVAAHVEYECRELGNTQRQIRTWNDFAPSDEEAVKRAAVYVAWLVHLRCLITFFRTEQTFGDEVLACHFMDDPDTWAREHESEIELSPAEKERVNRIDHLVAHITYERLKEASDFDAEDHQIAVKRLRIFYASLPDRHKPRFPSLAKLVA